jgi:hypothetical protein
MASGVVASAAMPLTALSVVPCVRDVFQECLEPDRLRHGGLNVHHHLRVGVIAVVPHEPRAHRLEQRVPVRAAHLQHVADAPVEVIFVACCPPEGQVAHRKGVVYKLRDRAVKVLDELPDVLAVLDVPERVVVVVHQRRDRGHVAVAVAVEVEAVPEDRLCAFGAERGELVAAARGDEIDRVVAVPVLEPVAPVEEFVTGVRTGPKPASHLVRPVGSVGGL